MPANGGFIERTKNCGAFSVQNAPEFVCEIWMECRNTTIDFVNPIVR